MNQAPQQVTLRFAPIIRVSTEKQGKRGESLTTQKSQVTQYVKTLGGVIPEFCWQYSGQEHATPDFERKKLAQLLHDAGKGAFDAVIVCDATRWSRDNRQSKEGLEVLRAHGIRFFVGTSEYSLFSPEQCFFLGMSAEIGEYQARIQKEKSITNRLERSKRNIPTCGKLPFGRLFDKKTETWSLDESKTSIIRQAASRYLAGESMQDIALSLSMNHSNLWKILTKRSGDSWQLRFRDKASRIDESLTLTIPRLLEEETIVAIQDKAAANKTYSHGSIKHKYLLSRMIFCKCCGYALMPQTNHNGKQYYRHPQARKAECTMSKWVPEAQVSPAVLANLVETFGDVERIEKAMKRAVPDHAKMEALRREHDDHKRSLAESEKERGNLIRLAAKGLLSDEEIESQMGEFRNKIAIIEKRLSVIESQTIGQPTAKQLKKRASAAIRVLRHVTSSPDTLLSMPYERQRKLVETIFSGKDQEGRRLGLYVSQTGDDTRPWRFEIRGIFNHNAADIPYLSSREESFEDEGGKFAYPYLSKSSISFFCVVGAF